MKKRKYNRFKRLLMVVVLFMTSLSVLAKMDTNEKNDISNEKKTEIKGEVYLSVPQISQYPTLPTGCESVAATMVLQYYGEDIQAEQFAEEWLECDSNFYYEDDTYRGPDPTEVFAGNPFSKNSYGCFAPVIEKAINENSSLCQAQTIIGESLESLCADYLNQDKPLLIWATMGMRESEEGNTWILEDGSEYTWIAGEHCLVLIGYDASHYYLNDPMSGATVGYGKEVVEARYAELGSQAVYISVKK